MRIRVTTKDDLQRAIDRLPAGPAEVILAPGVHHLTRACVIRRGDLTIKGTPGKTVLDGGCRITGWKEIEYNGRKLFAAPVPSKALHDGTIRQFFVNGVRQTRARYPRRGELIPVPTVPNPEKKYFLPTAEFQVRRGDFPPHCGDPAEADVILYTRWINALLPVTAWDPKTRRLSFGRWSRFPADSDFARYAFENIPEEIAYPGEYAYLRSRNLLLWLPPAGVDPATAETVVPAAGALLVLDGGGENTAPGRLSELSVSGITLRYGGAWQPDDDAEYDLRDSRLKNWRNYLSRKYPGKLRPAGSAQAAIELPAIVMLRGVTRASLRNVTVEHGGWYALNVGPGCSDIDVAGCRFTDQGGGGVVISGASASGAPRRRTGRVRITQCEISHCGRLHLSAVGILIGHACGNLLEHNDIFDLYYSGISCGWSWGYGETVTRENRIGFNHIHDLGHEMLCDMGGIYLLGVQPGSRIYNNLIHDVRCRFYGGWALYADEGTSHTVWERNICFDCSREGFHQHYGRENIIRFNIFAFNEVAGFALTTGTERLNGYAFPGANYRINVNLFSNVILQSPGKLFYRTWRRPHVVTPEEFYADCNLFRGTPETFIEITSRKHSFAEWQAAGLDRNSRFVDPGFVAPEKRDFHLRPDSMLRRLNFPDPAETIEQAGRTGKWKK